MENINRIKKDLLPVEWLGDSLERLKAFPDDVQDGIGHALHSAQTGGKSHKAKGLNKLGKVPHIFQKKSKSGIKTSKSDIDLIKSRYKKMKSGVV